jgi:hypothetical protein
MTTDELTRAKEEAQRLGLSGGELLENTSLALSECNGTGPQWLGLLAGVLSAIHPAMVTASHIHDLRYYYGGTEADRKRADGEWLTNCILVALDLYRWYDPRRYYVIHTAVKYYHLIRLGGGLSWKVGEA